MVKPLWEQKVELLLSKILMGWKKLNRLKTGNSGSCKICYQMTPSWKWLF